MSARLAILPFVAALTAAAAPAPLAPGEMATEVVATGIETRLADLVTFSLYVEESGPSDAETRRMAEDRIRRIAAAARSAGVAESDIRPSLIHFTSYREMTPELREAYRHQAELHWSVRREMRPGYDRRPYRYEEPPAFNATATAGIVVRLRDLARMAALQRALVAAGEGELDSPEFALTDQRPADAAARRQALAMARAEAEAQAAARGMRVVRIARVSERVGALLADRMVRDLFVNRRSAGGPPTGPEIEVRRPVAVTFVLAPLAP